MIDEETVHVSLRVAAIKVRLMELYTRHEADEWLCSPQPLLDDHRPIDLLADTLGYLEVDNVVDSMLDCVFL